jgi:hypothetical protein
MKRIPAPRGGRTDGQHRRHRPRVVPKWLRSSTQLEAVARSRCLMMLSVLSGETPVTDAIAQAKISRATYYQLETRALKAMLAAMNPLASSSASGAADLSTAVGRIAQLEAQVKRLEQDKRRSQRLLLLVRKSIRAPVTRGHRGRWPKRSHCVSDAPGASLRGGPSNPTPPGEHLP